MHVLAEQLDLYWTQLQAGQFPALGVWSYLLLAALVLVEGPIATLLGAAAASAGLMRPDLVFGAAAVANLAADGLWYSLGRIGHVDRLLRHGRRLGLRREHLGQLLAGMHSHACKILFVAKLTNALIVPALVAAGVTRVPMRRWLPVLLVAETLWTGALVVIGYHFTRAVSDLQQGLNYVPLIAAALALLALLVFGRRALRRSSQLEGLPPDASGPPD